MVARSTGGGLGRRVASGVGTLLAAVSIWVVGCGGLSAEAGAARGGGGSPVDGLYPSGFRLKALAADAMPAVAEPATKSIGLANPSFVDPVYGTRVYKVTDASDFAGASFVRHDYSRRQAFNADNTRFLGSTSDGYWLL